MSKSDDSRVSAVLPCFEEAPNLLNVTENLEETLAACVSSDWEILLVSSLAAGDGTPELARELAAGHSRVRTLWQPAGDPGYGRALAMGISAAQYPWLLLTDADGQFAHGELSRLTAESVRAEVVVGYRCARRDPLARRVAGKLYSGLAARLLGIRGVRDLDCAFKLVHSDVIGTTPLRCRTGVVNAEILMRAISRRSRLVEVPVTHRPRLGGTTRFEISLGPFGHLPHPAEVAAIFRDLAMLMESKP
ncbi:MAG TPA: glycosyltransferase family 2 protein [Myxococcota bacterium]|nr:glycosyltransferase family 2 protein [Myxococcota bacterium]